MSCPRPRRLGWRFLSLTPPPAERPSLINAALLGAALGWSVAPIIIALLTN